MLRNDWRIPGWDENIPEINFIEYSATVIGVVLSEVRLP